MERILITGSGLLASELAEKFSNSEVYLTYRKNKVDIKNSIFLDITDKDNLEKLADKIVYTGKIDEYFNYDLGILEYKTINFDHALLSLTYKEHIMFEEITRRFIIVDNVFRVVLPLTFFIIIIILFSNE